MTYPSIEQYQELVQSPQVVFTDPALAAGRVRASGLGTPIVVSGGFALTYALEASGTKYAVRCFHRDAPNLEKRYAAISQCLSGLRSSYFVQFEYQAKGLRANGALHPLVKMTWASGVTLGEFVEDNYNNPAALGNLVNSLSEMEAYLALNNLAHGDIQEGNLMVADQGKKLQLIDYDGMFVPALASLGGSELGHRDYQHPGRAAKHYDSTLDRFSLISINLALRALVAQPNLWFSSQSGAGVIVFRANDFSAPTASKILAEIGKIPSLARDVKNFIAICAGRFEQVPRLPDFLAAKSIPAFDVLKQRAGSIQLRQGYISQYPVLDGARYDLFEQHIGDMVELVGRVVEVRNAFTKHGKPYIFVNFGDWRTRSVKIALWSEALSTGNRKPSSEWIGRWVAIRGLVEPVYRGQKKSRYESITITATSLSQLVLITADEAQYRLNPIAAQPRTEQPSNADALQRLIGSASRPGETPSVRSQGSQGGARPVQQKPLTPNQQALARMQQQAGGSAKPVTMQPSSQPRQQVAVSAPSSQKRPPMNYPQPNEAIRPRTSYSSVPQGGLVSRILRAIQKLFS
ncbi:hypothetical protein GTP23_13185 [Pseudoduganella sp. FT93W]|uniref:Serine/threonine protein kinase n=1 Tax=Duganella fentianensis TaxID=2692177 RepID=A0A845HYA8_9BURK|nr:hypothetical protein [Duganella fentianensis]MYN46003.1 hypothetical protein [Duganella fentianensis]